MGRVFLFAIALCMTASELVSPKLATAQTISLGLDGHFRPGHWTEVRVDGVSEGPVAVLASDPHGQLVEYELAEQDGGYVGSIQIASPKGRCLILAGEPLRPVARFVPQDAGASHRWSERVWLTEGPPIGFELAEQRRNESSEEQDHATVVSVASIADVTVGALAVADVVVIADLAVKDPAGQAKSDRLRDWVDAGGHLVIAGGLSVESWAASPMAEWLPLRVEEASKFKNLNTTESRIQGSRGLRLRKPLDGVRLASDSGDEVVKSSFGPPVLRVAYGFGRVTAFAVDLREQTLQEWDSLDGLCLLLADEYTGSQEKKRDIARLTSVGVSELETQILASVDESAGTWRARPQLWTLFGRLLLYAFLIAGIDYVLVHKLIRRPQVTWVTMPVMAVAAFWYVTQPFETTATAATPDEPFSARSVALIDYTADTNRVRGQRWASLASENRARVNVSPRRPVSASETRFGWASAPETSFGGLYRANEADLSALRYRSPASRSELLEMPIEPRGTQRLQTSWSGRTDNAPVVASFSRLGARPIGTFSHDLPGRLTNWSLAVGRVITRPLKAEPLPPGESFTINKDTTDSRSLRETILGVTRGEVVGDKEAMVPRWSMSRQEYDPASLDVSRMILTGTFFDRAGGFEYANIRASRGAIAYDLSDLLNLNRCILVGRLEVDDDSHLQVFGRSEQQDNTTQPLAFDGSETYVRLIIPIRVDDDEP